MNVGGFRRFRFLFRVEVFLQLDRVTSDFEVELVLFQFVVGMVFSEGAFRDVVPKDDVLLRQKAATEGEEQHRYADGDCVFHGTETILTALRRQSLNGKE